MKSRNSFTVIQLNDSHAYSDLHQEIFWQGGQAVYFDHTPGVCNSPGK